MKQNDLKMKIDKIKKLLLENNIHIEQGLSDDEVRKIEKIYNVKFPSSGWNFIKIYCLFQNIFITGEIFQLKI